MSIDMDENDHSHLARMQKGAEDFVRFIEDHGERALKTQILSDAERKSVARSLEHLRGSFAEITKCTIDSVREPKPNLACYIYQNLWMLSAAAFLIGSKTTVSDAATKFIKIEQSKLAREGAAAKKAWLQNAVQEEVEAVKPQRLMAVSDDFAGVIRPGVLKRLGITEKKELTGWPKIGAIKNCLSKVKKGVS
jgi:hypothetical protein